MEGYSLAGNQNPGPTRGATAAPTLPEVWRLWTTKWNSCAY